MANYAFDEDAVITLAETADIVGPSATTSYVSMDNFDRAVL